MSGDVTLTAAPSAAAGAAPDAAGQDFARRLATAAGQFALPRLQPPEATLRWVAPMLADWGVTRSTSVTGLDSLGIPTWCAIRPNGLLLQVSNGKGLTDEAARISAIMESLELAHAEYPRPERLRRCSARQLASTGAALYRPDELPGYGGAYFAESYTAEWTCGRDLATGTPTWVPSSAVYFFRRPSYHATNSNGLAAGNSAGEAGVHALLELIERDAMCRIRENGRLRIREYARVIDTDTVEAPVLRLILDRCAEQRTTVRLLELPSVVPVHTFWAVFLGHDAVASVSTLNVGWGTHPDPCIAAARALTEAAQSRLGFIHGARDDLIRKPVHSASTVKDSPAYRFFDTLRPDVRWHEVAARPVMALDADPDRAVRDLADAVLAAGLGPLIDFDLTWPDYGIPVRRILAPRLMFDMRLF